MCLFLFDLRRWAPVRWIVITLNWPVARIEDLFVAHRSSCFQQPLWIIAVLSKFYTRSINFQKFLHQRVFKYRKHQTELCSAILINVSHVKILFQRKSIHAYSMHLWPSFTFCLLPNFAEYSQKLIWIIENKYNNFQHEYFASTVVKLLVKINYPLY